MLERTTPDFSLSRKRRYFRAKLHAKNFCGILFAMKNPWGSGEGVGKNGCRLPGYPVVQRNAGNIGILCWICIYGRYRIKKKIFGTNCLFSDTEMEL
jgi:hypothetical protein